MVETLAQLAQRVGGKVTGDPSVAIERVTSVRDADAAALTFATDARYFAEALASDAGAVLADEALLEGREHFEKPVLAVASARVALAIILKSFERPVPSGEFRHPSAIIDPSADLGSDVYVGPLVSIGERSVVGKGTTLQAGALVGADVHIGEGCVLHARATVLDASRLGNRVIVHSGAVVGSEGFGWAFVEGRLQKIPQVGNVVLGDDVEIGANTCVDRAQTGSTTIGRGSKIDNLVQIGHNCEIGENTAIAAQCGLAGTTAIGSYVQIGGQVGFRGHVTIGDRVKIGGGSAVWGDIPADSFVSGRPARAHKEEMRREVMVRKLPKLFSRVDALENADKSAD
ncbi:MAG: UDP-3-O-(3-hydroxymyristoyl)glucosamine N-acyltransferase [Vulcanimicrobiaceae bacterium]